MAEARGRENGEEKQEISESTVENLKHSIKESTEVSTLFKYSFSTTKLYVNVTFKEELSAQKNLLIHEVQSKTGSFSWLSIFW